MTSALNALALAGPHEHERGGPEGVQAACASVCHAAHSGGSFSRGWCDNGVFPWAAYLACSVLASLSVTTVERWPGWVLVLSASVFGACGSTERAPGDASSESDSDRGATATSTSTGGTTATAGQTTTAVTTATATTMGTTGAMLPTTATTTGTTGGEELGVACDDAVDGDPCGPTGGRCGPLDGYGCAKICVEGAWSVNCVEAPTCETSTVEQLGRCDAAAALRCGPFTFESACGEVSAMAVCGWRGWWYYELPCDPPCEALDEAACTETLGCAWVVTCDSEFVEELEPGCRDVPSSATACASVDCPDGTECVETAVNPFDLGSGDCSGAGSLVTFCVAP